MTGHLPDERWIDLIDGTATSDETVHLAACAACTDTFQELRDCLAAARAAEVPEPSPLYWQNLRRNVDQRIEREGAGLLRGRAFLGWMPALGGLAVLALVATFYPVSHRRDARPISAVTLPAWNALPPASEDEGLAVLQGLDAGEEDLAGIAPSSVAGLVSELSESESEALVRVLRADLAGRSS